MHKGEEKHLESSKREEASLREAISNGGGLTYKILTISATALLNACLLYSTSLMLAYSTQRLFIFHIPCN